MVALIPAAGRGARFTNANWLRGSKIFAPLLGRPVLRHTVEVFASHAAISRIVVVTGPEDMAQCQDILSGIGKPVDIVAGGATRQESVALGLSSLVRADDPLVLVHDGARPLLTSSLISRCIAAADAFGNAVAAVPVVDTLKTSHGDGVVTGTVDRSHLWAVQTPQCFPLSVLLEAHAAAQKDNYQGSDESSLVERLGFYPVHLAAGDLDNFKITHPEDLLLAETILQGRKQKEISPMRIGYGYDIHRFIPGRRLVLGGVEISHPSGLDGHSDADVLLHALMDALLGAAALPDIGHFFPNTDPQYAGVNSADLLSKVQSEITTAGYAIINADMTLIAETPKIGPYIAAMKEVIAERLAVLPSQVGIKATTHEGLGAIGAGLGISAHAAVLLSHLPGG